MNRWISLALVLVLLCGCASVRAAEPANSGRIPDSAAEPDDPGAPAFSDVPDDAYYAEAVRWAVENGVTVGTSADRFSPKATCTRAQIVTFLWRAAGSPEADGSAENPFSDVSETAYYADAVLWATSLGITSGTSADRFSPKADCTRAQIVTFLWRAAGSPEPETTDNPFEDVPSDKYYCKAVLWAAETGVTSGTSDTTFSPGKACTRAEAVTFLWRSVWAALPDEEADGGPANTGFEDDLTGWTVEGEAAVTDDLFYEGSHALRIGAPEAYETTVSQRIRNLEPGYYYLEARTRNEGGQEACYLFAESEYLCKTAVPRSIRDGEWTVTTVRGIAVGEDGRLRIGVSANGGGQLAYFDEFSLIREADQSRRYPNLFGGAVSWLDWEEDMGALYYDENGVQGDALQILRDNGCNAVRLELYNNPGAYRDRDGNYFPAGYKDADAIFALAQRADALGMEIFLSFMYSDYWGNDVIPQDWLEVIEELPTDAEKVEALSELLYNYTRSFLLRLQAAGIQPRYVSIGNEIDPGILRPYGSSYDSAASAAALAMFLNSGYQAVKEVFPDTQVVLHVGCNANDLFWANKSGGGIWFFDLMEQYGVQYDVIGTSFYPYWAQTDSEYAVKKSLDLKDLKEWCEMMIDRYDRDILICESGYNWGTPGQLANNGAYEGIYPSSPEGQQDFVIDLINTVKSVRDGRCVGDFYWDPVLVRQDGIGWALYGDGQARPNVVETTTFFDYDHVALPVLHAYRDNTITK